MTPASARERALRRVEFVFGHSEGGIKGSDRFDVELTGRPPNDFQPNEFDQLLEDAQQMQRGDGKVGNEIVTVDDFCALAERYSLSHPRAWSALVGQWDKAERMTTVSAWRRAVWKLIGL
jgi:hypothetical protein